MKREHLRKVQEALSDCAIDFTYVEEDGCASIDFMHRGLSYHIWEYADDEIPCGVETNLYHAGKTEEIEGDYDTLLAGEIRSWG